MKLITIARPYAKALFTFAKERDELAHWSTVLRTLARIAQEKKVVAMLTSPNLSSVQRVEHMVFLVKESIDVYEKNFLSLLAEHKRLLLLPWVAYVFFLLKDQEENIQNVTFFSAYPLSNEHKKILINKVALRLGKTVTVNTVIDPSLVGGVKICAGDWVCDYTVHAQLNTLAKAIVT